MKPCVGKTSPDPFAPRVTTMDSWAASGLSFHNFNFELNSFLWRHRLLFIRRKYRGSPIASKAVNQWQEKAAESLSPSQGPRHREVVAAPSWEVFHSCLSGGICRESLLPVCMEKTHAETVKAAGGPSPRLWYPGACCSLQPLGSSTLLASRSSGWR